MLWQSRLAMTAISAWLKTEHPPLLDLASRQEEIAKQIADHYSRYLKYVSPVLIRSFRDNRDQIIMEVWQDAKGQDGELGATARQYPEWFQDTCRRLLNLMILAAGGG